MKIPLEIPPWTKVEYDAKGSALRIVAFRDPTESELATWKQETEAVWKEMADALPR